ncbi:MAG: hypothetical protein HYX37_21455 [Rhizobiales bacterium]|nr:hypothetical protein [Hyphomicrobiales bacterium]
MLAVAGICLISASTIGAAQSSTAKIVGIGAATCTDFLDNIDKTPVTQRDYLAWAQGFMSGVLLSRPARVDQNLDLKPAEFGLLKQLEFLRQWCAANRSQDFSDAVLALYKNRRIHSRP